MTAQLPEQAPISNRRPQCGACLLPLRRCICRWVTPVHVVTRVIILQHPLEVAHAKNTARLLHMCLPNSLLLVGETWTELALANAGVLLGSAVLLYPSSIPSEQAWAPGVLPLQAEANGSPTDLVVLDATWRKSRKMLHLSPCLQAMPRLSLDQVPPSRYFIRRAHRAGQLSTLEATCAALGLLDGQEERREPVLRAFDGFVAQQMAHLPALGNSPRQPDA